MSTAMLSSASTGGQQSGGVSPLAMLTDSIDSIQNLVYGGALVLLIVYANNVPTGVRTTVDSFVGRIVGLAIIVATARFVGWVYGLLAAVAFLLILRGAPATTEGFRSIKTANVEHPNEKWFVEKVLGERPKRIVTDRIGTQSVQDNSNSGMRSRGR